MCAERSVSHDTDSTQETPVPIASTWFTGHFDSQHTAQDACNAGIFDCYAVVQHPDGHYQTGKLRPDVYTQQHYDDLHALLATAGYRLVSYTPVVPMWMDYAADAGAGGGGGE